MVQWDKSACLANTLANMEDKRKGYRWGAAEIVVLLIMEWNNLILGAFHVKGIFVKSCQAKFLVLWYKAEDQCLTISSMLHLGFFAKEWYIRGLIQTLFSALARGVCVCDFFSLPFPTLACLIPPCPSGYSNPQELTFWGAGPWKMKLKYLTIAPLSSLQKHEMAQAEGGVNIR